MDDELKKLQGTWKVAELDIDRSHFTAQHLPDAKIVVEGDKFKSLGMGADYEGTLEVDSSAHPKVFRMKFTTGPEKGNVNQGIYELDGDKWKFALDTKGGPPPSKFAATPGTGHALQTLVREK